MLSPDLTRSRRALSFAFVSEIDAVAI